MYKSYAILDFNLIFFFEFKFKCTLMPFNILFYFHKTHIINLIQIFIIKIRSNIFMCFLFSTYYNILLQENFIHGLFKNSIVLFLAVKFISICGILPMVLCMPTISMLITKVSQDLVFI